MPLFGPPDVEILKAKKIVNGLIKALGYRKYATIREAAAEALGQIGDLWAVEPLITALNDEKENVRSAAAKALGRIGDARAVEPLILYHKEKNVLIAIEALGQIGDTRASEPLIAELKNKNWVIREAATKALGRIGDACAIEPLIAVLKDDNSHVCNAAADALDALGWQPKEGEVGAIYWISKGVWDRCIEIGSPAVKPLVTALTEFEWDARKAIVGVLDEHILRLGGIQERA